MVGFETNDRLANHCENENAVADINMQNSDSPTEPGKTKQINAKTRMDEQQDDKNQRCDNPEDQ